MITNNYDPTPMIFTVVNIIKHGPKKYREIKFQHIKNLDQLYIFYGTSVDKNSPK